MRLGIQTALLYYPKLLVKHHVLIRLRVDLHLRILRFYRFLHFDLLNPQPGLINLTLYSLQLRLLNRMLLLHLPCMYGLTVS